MTLVLFEILALASIVFMLGAVAALLMESKDDNDGSDGRDS